MRKQLTDAKRKLHLEVLPEDVQTGKRYDKNDCVIARAICATNPNIKRVEVGSRFVHVYTGRGKAVRYQVPEKLSRTIVHFDKTGSWPEDVVGDIVLKPPTPGRTLEHEKEYERQRTAKQKANKKQFNPERQGAHKSHTLSTPVRVATIKWDEPESFSNADVLAGEGL